jgi:DNA-binding response OmpR family regulator
LKICRNITPDAVILDIMMPDMDGASVAEELKEKQKMKKVPILFLTAAVKQSEVPKDHKIGE